MLIRLPLPLPPPSRECTAHTTTSSGMHGAIVQFAFEYISDSMVARWIFCVSIARVCARFGVCECAKRKYLC